MEIKLGELIVNFDSKRKPLSKMVREKMKGIYPYYGAASIFDYVNDYIFDGEYILLGEDGTVLNTDGTPILQLTKGKFWANNHTHVLKNNERLVDFKYLYYLLKNTVFSEIVTGAVQQKISQGQMNALVVNYNPDKNVQEKIASILSTIDDKIELNDKMNENLEGQAKAIFKSWFIDFEPYGGIMPSNWKIGILSDIADVLSGKRPKNRVDDADENHNIPLVGAASIMGYTNNYNFNEKILITGRVGTHGVIQRFNTPCWSSDNTLIIKTKFYEYTWLVLRGINYSSMNRGSTQPLITQSDLKKVEIIVPSDLVLIDFEDTVSKLMDKYESNIEENKKLTELRDTLLPKLMSGVIDVRDLDI